MDLGDPNFRVLMVGVGRLGSAILLGWREVGALGDDRIWARLRPGAENLTGLTAASDEVCGYASAVVVAVKPKDVAGVAAHLAPLLSPQAVIVSVAAGLSTARLSEAFGGRSVARVMPTTAVATGRGTASVFAADAEARTAATALFAPIAEVVQLDDEALIDAATAISGSGPAYLYTFVEALAAAGEARGLPPEVAARLARSTVTGAAALLESGPETSAMRIAQVASPGGTTEAGLAVLRPRLEPLMLETVEAAAKRAGELAQG